MNFESIKQISQEILNWLGVSVDDIEIATDHELDLVVVNIKTPERGIFTYNDSEVVKAMHHIIKIIAEKRGVLDLKNINHQYILDVNNQQTKHVGDLKAKARLAVSRVKSFATSMELEPMSAYDRLIIHTFLAKDNAVKTESIGEGQNRRVVVKPVSF